MNIKKLSSLALTALFVLSFAACANEKDNEDTKKEKEEMEAVDDKIKSDQERADSLKKELGIE